MRSGSFIAIKVDRLVAFVWLASGLVYALGLFHFVLIFLLGFEPNRGLLRIINLDAEAVLPSWYSSVLLLGSGLLLLIAGLLDDRRGRTQFFWLGLAALMVYMSLDETVSLHESSARVVGALGVPEDAFAAPVFRWLVLGVPAVLVVGALSIPMLRRIDGRTAALFLLAGGFYVFGAVVMEFVGSGPMAESMGRSVAAGLSVTIEEGFEILGLTLFLTAVLSHLARNHPVAELRLQGDETSRDALVGLRASRT